MLRRVFVLLTSSLSVWQLSGRQHADNMPQEINVSGRTPELLLSLCHNTALLLNTWQTLICSRASSDVIRAVNFAINRRQVGRNFVQRHEFSTALVQLVLWVYFSGTIAPS